MHKWVAISLTVGLLSACSGGHNLDNPIKTCKAITTVLAGDKSVVWHAEKQTEQQGSQLQVTLDFSLVGEPQGEVSQAVCIYAQSSQDMDYRNAMGEYANTPTSMLINGMPIPANDLVQAVNRATADTVHQVIQKSVSY
ncbi:MAG TPA: hypothetical protein PLE99_06930 [Candidatus Thiothrix moscowensis]|uniref:hypothetical protein n=1 Tax=unclassified Thiothrix TaxID=2636184 RepID=UPI0025E5CFF1|nr:MULTISPECIES: hypothetical protein [unclassified Thiothrix]HRJ52482.1 hypothetical protein [Candidatus Thiothrix moscowensis]